MTELNVTTEQEIFVNEAGVKELFWNAKWPLGVCGGGTKLEALENLRRQGHKIVDYMIGNEIGSATGTLPDYARVRP